MLTNVSLNACITLLAAGFLFVAEMSTGHVAIVTTAIGLLLGIITIAATYQFAGTAGFTRWSWLTPLKGTLLLLPCSTRSIYNSNMTL